MRQTSNETLLTSPPTQPCLYITPPIGSTMPSELDQAVDAASEDLSTCKYRSTRAAAAAHGLSHATLTRRLREGKSRGAGHEFQQLLSSTQEDMVVQWVLDLERQGHAPPHTQLREMAVQISINSGGPDKVGNH